MAGSPLGLLIGSWEFEPSVEGRSPGRGHATFEWIEGGAFVLERSEAEWTDPGWVENAPKSTQSIIGFDDTTPRSPCSTRTRVVSSGSTGGR